MPTFIKNDYLGPCYILAAVKSFLGTTAVGKDCLEAPSCREGSEPRRRTLDDYFMPQAETKLASKSLPTIMFEEPLERQHQNSQILKHQRIIDTGIL
jgi:hypothetical protein